MDLARDVLDNRVIDRVGTPIGRVDGIVLRVMGDMAPEVTAIELGGVTPVRRLRPPFRWIAGWFVRCWGMLRGEPWRIPWSDIQRVGIDVVVSTDVRDTPLHAWEHRARRVLGRIPGA